jgi:peptide/nickel transport system substrate-binding protein
MDGLQAGRITRRAFLAQAGLAAGAVGLVACGMPSVVNLGAVKPRRGGIVRVSTADGTTADDMSLYTQRNIFQVSMINSMYENLVYRDNNFQLHPMLATSWSTSDSVTYTFKIRQGVKFHDGTPMTAKDVVYSIQQELTPASGSDINSELGAILDPKRVIALDDYTVQMTLSQEFVFLPGVLANRYGKIFKAGTSAAQFTAAPNGTGPFMYQSFSPGQSFTAVRNPHYWQPGLPYLDGISYTNITEPSSRAETVLTGQADWMDAVPYAAAAQFKNNPRVGLQLLKDAIWSGMVTDLSKHPFNDYRVVQAMKMGINRQQVISTVFAGYASEGFDGPVPSSDPVFPAGLKNTYDPQGAKQLLAAAGYPNGLKLPDCHCLPAHAEVPQSTVVQQQLSQIGITFNIVQDATNFWTNIYQAVPFFVPEFWRRPAFDVLQLLYTSDEDTRLTPDMNDPLIKQADATADPSAQNQLFTQILTNYQQHEGWIVPAYGDFVFGKSAKLHGVQSAYVEMFNFTNAFLTT